MKNWLYLGIFLAGILIGSVIMNVKAQNNVSKAKWEYKVENFAAYGAMERGLNKYALEGWELVAVTNVAAILKREVSN